MRRLSRRLVDWTACAALLLTAIAALFAAATEPEDPGAWRARRGAARGAGLAPGSAGGARGGAAGRAGGLAEAARLAPGPDVAAAGSSVGSSSSPGVTAPEGAATGVEGEAAAAAARGSSGGPDGTGAASAQARLAGRVVVEKTGLPPPGEATVTARRRARGPDPQRVDGVADRDGRFELALPPGDWTLAARLEGWASTRGRAKVEAGKAPKAVELRLAPARDALAGSVVTEDGAPVGGARVTVERRGGGVRVRRRVTTGPDGAFRADGLADGLYRLTAEADGYRAGSARDVPVAEGRGGAPARLVLRPAASLEGTLRRPDGAPAAGVRVTAHRDRGRRELGRATTDAAGRFGFSRLGEGPTELIALADDGALVARGSTSLSPGVPAVLDLVLAPAPSIAGRVTGPDGAPRAGVRVAARARMGRLRREAKTDAEGRYALERLVPGAYVVDLPRPRSPSAARAEVEVAAGAARCDLQARDGTTLRGVVRGLDGAPVRGANVFAVMGGRERARARTDDRGAFVLRGLSEGDARLLVRARDDTLVGEHPLPVPHEAQVEGLGLVARPAPRVVGFVVDAAGAPLPDVTLHLRSGPVRRSASTGQDGRFALGPLYGGEYQLTPDAASLELVARRRGVVEVTLSSLTLAVADRDVACELRAVDGAALQQ